MILISGGHFVESGAIQGMGHDRWLLASLYPIEPHSISGLRNGVWPGDYRYPGMAERQSIIGTREKRRQGGAEAAQGRGRGGGNRVFSLENSEITRRVVPLAHRFGHN